MIDDRELAEDVVARLNGLISNPEVRLDIERLLEQRIDVCRVTAEHPTLQVSDDGKRLLLGPLGLLNGIVGAITGGQRAGWGHIAAVYDDEGHLHAFAVVESPEV